MGSIRVMTTTAPLTIDQVAERFRDETDIEALFDRLNGRLSPDLRAVQVGSYDYPLPIKLYLRPE